MARAFLDRLPWLVAAACVGALHGSMAAAQPAGERAPAATLMSPASATKAPDPEGFLQRWLILEPIPVAGQLGDSAVRALVETSFFPEQRSVIPSDGDTVKVGDATLTWHAVDTLNYNVNLYHFAYARGKPTSNVLFWAVTVIDAPRELRDVRLAIGSNSASVWWVNGEEVTNLYNDRQTVIDDGVSKRITLKKGRNVIRAAIVNAGGATDFCARFLSADALPLRDLVVDLVE